jgi:DnaJ-class molecular chaperone
MIADTDCPRCNGSGEIGRRMRGTKEAPGPVPEDARGWMALQCPDCHGSGVIAVDLNDDADEDGN